MEFIAFTVLLSLAALSVVPTPQSFGERIVGGQDTTIEEHPYQLSMQFENSGHLCGASLLTPNIALTAAHCIEFTIPRQWKVRAGSTKHTSGGILVDVLKYCTHPKYNSSINDYDVSVILLDESLSLGRSIQTISLQEAGAEIRDGTDATVTGWGALWTEGPLPDVLQEVKIPKVDWNECSRKYGTITDRMDCFGYAAGGKDSCQGDSGGPVVIDGKQVGIVTNGQKCASPGYPGVYASVTNREIHDHIEQCIQMFSSQ